MKNRIVIALVMGLAMSMFAAKAEAFGTRGQWIASGGLGITISPSTFLITPQLEYVQKQNLFIGPMVQMGLANGGVLFTASATARFLIGTHPKVKPAVEGGLGLAMASGLGGSAVGVHILGGLGVDYLVDRNIAIGTMVRMNFAPPLQTFFASWPIIVGRFAI